MRRSLPIALVLFAVMALAACAQNVNLLDDTKLQDSSLLSGEPCEAPCWNGITPGETSYRDAKLILESDGQFKITEESEAEGDNPGRTFTFAEGENNACCQVISGDGETIGSLMLQLAPTLSFGPLFDKYGEPDYVTGQLVSEEQGYVVLVYTEAALVLYSYVEGGAEGAVSVGNKIIGALYLSQDGIEQALTCAQMNTWKGFQPLTTYTDTENFDYVGSGVGDETICPTN